MTGRPPRPALVLCYHAVSEDWPSELAVTPSGLRHQLELLVRHGYRGAVFSAAVPAPARARTLVVTFDDAYRSTLELAYPILASLGLPASVFVPTDFPGRPGAMSWPGIDHWASGPYADELRCLDWDQLRWLAGKGWEVGSHSRSHARLPELERPEGLVELEGSRTAIEEALGQPCRVLAYPYGAADARVVEWARATGYRAAAVLGPSPLAAQALAWPRVGVYRGDSDWRFRAKLSARMRELTEALRRWRG